MAEPRKSECRNCGNEIVQFGRGGPRQYCSEECRSVVARAVRNDRYVPRPARPRTPCGHGGCPKTVAAEGYCQTHLARFRTHGTTIAPEMCCTDCGVGLGRYGWWAAKCRPCKDRAKEKQAAANRERNKKRRDARTPSERIRHQRKERAARYGLTLDQVAELLLAQGNACPICRTPLDEGTRGMHIDHSHQSGDVRGLLCPHCNKGLGYFHDDPARLLAAAAYLESGGVIVAT